MAITAQLTRSLFANEQLYIAVDNEIIVNCGSWQWWASCTGNWTPNWSHNTASTSVPVQAVLWDGASGSASTSLAIPRTEFNVELLRSNASIKVGESASVYAHITDSFSIMPSPYWLRIRDDDSNQVVAQCRSWNNDCGFGFAAGWDNNHSGVRHFSAYAESDAGDVASNVATISVAIQRFEFNVEIYRSNASIKVGESASVYARVTNGSIPPTPYWLRIRDDDSDQVVAQCRSWNNDCGYGFAAGWDNNHAGVRHFSAYAESDDGDVASNVVSISIAIERFEFNVEIYRSSASVKVGDSASVYARVTNGSIPPTPYWLRIRDDDTGQVVAQCRTWNNDCGYGFAVDWSENQSPHDKHFSAYAESDLGDVASNVASTTIGVEQFRYELAIVSDPGSVDIPGSSWVTATITNTGMWGKPYALFIKDEETGDTVAGCYNWWNACSYQYTSGWAENGSSGTHRFSAYMAPSAESNDRPSNKPSTSIAIHQRRFEIEMSSDPSEITAPRTVNLTAHITDGSVVGTPYSIVIRDEKSNAIVARCNNAEGVCPYARSASWDEIAEGGELKFSAYVGNDSETFSNTATAEVALVAPSFDVSLHLEPVAPEESEEFNATAHSSPGVGGTPFALQIRDDEDAVIASCNSIPGETCAATVPDGDYYAAVVSPSGKVLGRSDSWVADDGEVSGSDGSPNNDGIGVDLVLLAKKIGTKSELCASLLTGPGTHLNGTSTTDQYNQCELVVAATDWTVLRLLRDIAAGAVGVAVINYLWNQFGNRPPIEWGSPSDPGNTHPGTAPPPPLPSEPEVPTVPAIDFNQMLDEMVANNPEHSRDKLRLALRQCVTVATRAFQPFSDCSKKAIFVASSFAYPNATKLERQAQAFYPIWGMPHVQRAAHPGNRLWYNQMPECNEAARIQASTEHPGVAFDCHEFPYAAMAEGGEFGAPRPRIRLIPAGENRSEGNLFGKFINKCMLPEEAPFFYVPAPERSPLPTMAICN